MSTRSDRITKLHSLLKKKYKAQPPAGGRNLFEQLLFACLLEEGSQDAADEGIAKLEQDYFDWNEVRVTTVSELAESIKRLPNATGAAARLKKNLHALFETYYSFDIEELKKQNLGKTIKDLGEFSAMTPFILSYIVQHGLGGHAIPVNTTGMEIFYYCGVVNESERQGGKVPGIERAIPKAKGVEFGSLLHQMSLDFAANPRDPDLRAIILKLNPEAENLLPGMKKKASKATDKKASKKATPAKKKPAAATKSSKAAPKQKTGGSGATKKKTAKTAAPKKKSSAPKKKATAPKKSAVKSKAAPKKKTKTNKKAAAPAKKKRSATKKLAKKKPR